MSVGVPVPIQRQIIESELALWRQTRYLHEVRLRVHKRAGFDQEQIKPILTELERCERMIDGYEAELTALTSDAGT